VPRSYCITSEEGAPLPDECAKLHRRIASHTRARRFAVKVRTNKRLKDRLGKFALKILDVERDLQLISNTARIICSIQRTAALSATVHSIRRIMQTHPDADYFVARLNKERRSNGGVNATRERHQHPLWRARNRLSEPAGWEPKLRERSVIAHRESSAV
jgi:hypothetical protein